jgi:hypothetical protein
MHVQLVAPVAVVLIVDPADIDSPAGQHGLHRLSRHHRQLHELDCLIARELRAILYRDFRVDDEMPAIAARDVRMRRHGDFEVSGFEYERHG